MIAMGQLAIACGGTGGHLFPGLAVAEAMRGRGHEVSYFVSEKAVDRRALRGAGEEEHGVPIPAVGWGGVGGAGHFAVQFISAVRRAGEEMRRRKIGALLGMGGFISAAAVGAARVASIPYFLHESNAVPGRATRLLARGAEKVFVGFSECEKGLGGVTASVSGTPVRNRLGRMQKEEALKKLGLHPRRRVVAVLGGSQGAKGLNEAMLRGLEALKRESEHLQILHLAGEAHAEKVRKGYEGSGFHAVVMGFCDEMEAVYGAAEVVVARAGAGTLAELAACQVPAILVPFPAAAGDHQTANARAYAKRGAAEVVAEKNLGGAELGQRIATLMAEPNRREEMRLRAREQDQPQAAEKIAEVISGIL
ncbi:MAG: UDP-N-acetylglucosamine--N-acetylmuramyl-(pentapeptide) pyrophosphoryl-undecaprenol N-acetylglucosamine transferase [Verrucomicrobia bacterium]|nr:UDP-N-acetylglucosamine--N-acetylmuramyl-(pentapeptide) pyrophosphoryl-undecaprenol N-acetylglucosamine transferase [Verrucomicrobiota bacterium]NBY66434.1 UDP-N-acetylglucosamine--N-acetylmuramyl-(pentapeptide) pyrophosphoryl-undecaprenol N-acetylglucosamine transferase [Verrucomicrobiota bacterium]